MKPGEDAEESSLRRRGVRRAKYGMFAKTLARLVIRIRTVISDGRAAMQSSMKSLTTYVDCIACCRASRR